MPVVSDTECRADYKPNNYISDDMMCAGVTGKDSCQVGKTLQIGCLAI